MPANHSTPEVTRADREIAASVLPPHVREEVLRGDHDTVGDCSATVQAFVRHRLASATPARGGDELLIDLKGALEYSAGCDEGVDQDTASSEIMGWAGAWLSLAYDKICARIASTDMAGAGEARDAGEQFVVKSGESRHVFGQRIMQGRKCVAMADEPMASRIAVALTAHAPSPIAYDVRRLVIAARRATDSDGGASELSSLLDAVEAFSSRVPYEDEPDDMPAAPPVEGLTSGECSVCSGSKEMPLLRNDGIFDYVPCSSCATPSAGLGLTSGKEEAYPEACPVCHGDCGSANPPVSFCPMRVAANPAPHSEGLTSGEGKRATWLRDHLHYLIQFYIYAEATKEDVQSVINGLSESDAFDDKVAALVQMPRWCGQDEAQEAVDRHFASPKATATASVREDWLRGDWYEKWEDATENADDELMATLEALRGRVERTILAALTDSGTAATIGGERA